MSRQKSGPAAAPPAPAPAPASPQDLWLAGWGAMAQAAQAAQAATQALGPLEGLFGQRVAKAMEQLGMPDPAALAALRDQVQALTARVEQLEARLAAAEPAPAAPARKKAPRAR